MCSIEACSQIPFSKKFIQRNHSIDLQYKNQLIGFSMIQLLLKGIFRTDFSINSSNINDNMKSILTIYFDASSLYKVDWFPSADLH